MGTRCETEGKYLVSIFRSHVAQKLVNTYHLTQVEAAQKVGTTQAAISQYMCSKRANAASKQCNDILPKIQTLADSAAQRLAKGETNWKQVSLDFCKACSKGFETEIELTGDHYSI
jgi:predicted transcriptional regulator